MTRRTGRILALVVGAALALGFLWSQRPGALHVAAPRGAAPVPVSTAPVRLEDVPVVVEALGTVRSRHEATLSAEVAARVLSVAAVAGEAVRGGDVLIELEAAELAAQEAAARAGLVAAREALAEAERELERTRTLFRSEARSQLELDAAGTLHAQASARAEAAAQAAEAATVMLGRARVRAPFDGVLLARLVDPGDLATPGLPLLVVQATGQPRLEASVAQELLAGLAPGAQVDVVLGAAGDAAPLRTRGVVEELHPSVDPATRHGLVVLALPELEAAGAPAVPAGSSGRALLPAGTRAARLVPAEALVVRGQVQMVFAPWEDERGSTRARMHLVRAGSPRADGSIELLSGAGGIERVITAGAAELRDGAPVREGGAGDRGER